MKRFNKALIIALTSTMLFACDDIVARPGTILDNDNLVNFGDPKNDYYGNDFEGIYDQMISAGTSNETIFDAIITEIAKSEVSKFYNLTKEQFETVLTNVTNGLAGREKVSYDASISESATKIENIITEHVKDALVDIAKGDSYNVDYLFQEEKLVNELRSQLYLVGDLIPGHEDYNTDYLITADSTYEDIFFADYTDYIEKEIYPSYLKTLLTSVYIYNRDFNTIGRSYARDVTYIQLTNIEDHLDSVPRLINAYFDAYFNGRLPTDSFDLISLSRLYNGVYDENELSDPNSTAHKEAEFASTAGIFTKSDEMAEDLSHVATQSEPDGEWEFLKDTDPNYNSTLASEYTGSYSYPLEWGITLKERELQSSTIYYDDGMAVRSGGLSDLPSSITSRLFRGVVENYLDTIHSDTYGDITLLTPESVPSNPATGDYSSQYAIYDSGTSSYYIVIVNGYYNTSSFRDEQNAEVAQEIARILGDTENYQTSAFTYYLDYYDLTFGDQDFYDYIETNYPSVFDDNYSYKN